MQLRAGCERMKTMRRGKLIIGRHISRFALLQRNYAAGKSLKPGYLIIDPCGPARRTGGSRYETGAMEIDRGQVLPTVERPSTWVWEFHSTRMQFCAELALIRKCDFPYQLVISIRNAEPTLAFMGTVIQRRRDHRSSSIEKAPLSA